MSQEHYMEIQELMSKIKELEAFTARLKLSKPLPMECHRIPVWKLAGNRGFPVTLGCLLPCPVLPPCCCCCCCVLARSRRNGRRSSWWRAGGLKMVRGQVVRLGEEEGKQPRKKK